MGQGLGVAGNGLLWAASVQLQLLIFSGMKVMVGEVPVLFYHDPLIPMLPLGCMVVDLGALVGLTGGSFCHLLLHRRSLCRVIQQCWGCCLLLS